MWSDFVASNANHSAIVQRVFGITERVLWMVQRGLALVLSPVLTDFGAVFEVLSWFCFLERFFF